MGIKIFTWENIHPNPNLQEKPIDKPNFKPNVNDAQFRNPNPKTNLVVKIVLTAGNRSVLRALIAHIQVFEEVAS